MNTVYNRAAISEIQRDYMNIGGTVHSEFSPRQFYPELLT